MLGAAGDCRDEIDSAYDAFRASPPEHGEPEWSYWMDEGSLNEQIGKCYLWLSDYPAACRHLEASLRPGEEWQESYIRDGVSVLIALASAHARAGDPEQACAVGARAVDTLSGRVNSARLTEKLRVLSGALGQYHDVPAVREFRED